MPLEGAFGAAAALAAMATLVAVAGTVRGHMFRRPDREATAGLLLILGVVCYGMSDAALRDHDLGQRLGAPHRLLTDAATMAAMCAVLALLVVSGQPWAEARLKILHRLTSLTACVTGMALCAASGTGSGETLIYFTLYVAFLGATLAEILAISWHQARYTWQRPLGHACYLLAHAGALAGAAALAGQAVWAVATTPHMLPPMLPAARSCAGLASPPQCVFTVALPSASVLLCVIGVALPVLGGGVAGMWRFWRHVWMLRALRPLWERMRHTFPQIVLPEHGTRGRLDPAFRMYRRVIEIGDGRAMLRPYMRPGVSAATASAAARLGLRGDELRATVEAAEIVAALRARRNADCFDPPPRPDHANAEVPDLTAEAAWLVKVARAYATSPIVYSLVANQH
jgi:hypothetical protein